MPPVFEKAFSPPMVPRAMLTPVLAGEGPGLVVLPLRAPHGVDGNLKTNRI